MTAMLMSQDILGICLLVSGGNLSMTLEDVVKRVEEFQSQNDRHFGILNTDFRTLFCRLLWTKFPGSLLRGESESNLYKVNLQDVVLDILKYGAAYFNDEGENWDLFGNDPIYNPVYYYNCSEKEFYTGQAVRKSMTAFFQSLEGKTTPLNQIQDMLTRLGYNQDTLFRYSRPGDAS
jgi:hypothetical protein